MEIDPTAFIHENAVVKGSKIGARTKVWQFATVIRGAVLGEDCTVASCATIDGAIFGDRCIISQGVAMGPGFKFGNDVFVGPNAVMVNDAFPSASKDGFDYEALRCGRIAILVDDGVIIGANATIFPGVHLYRNSVVAAGTVCRKDIPEKCMMLRSGEIIRKPDDWQKRRMRWAK